MKNVINIEGLEKLAKAMVNIEESARKVVVNAYRFFVWDSIGDHYETIYAEDLKEAKHDLLDSIAEHAYIYEGRVRYRLVSVEKGKPFEVVA